MILVMLATKETLSAESKRVVSKKYARLLVHISQYSTNMKQGEADHPLSLEGTDKIEHTA